MISKKRRKKTSSTIYTKIYAEKKNITIYVCILDFLIQNEWVKKWMNETETVYIGKMPRRSNLWMADFIAA